MSRGRAQRAATARNDLQHNILFGDEDQANLRAREVTFTAPSVSFEDSGGSSGDQDEEGSTLDLETSHLSTGTKQFTIKITNKRPLQIL